MGPSDPELITVKGLRLLQAAPIVAFPAGLGDRAGMAQTIVSLWLQPHQVQLALSFPYVQESALLSQAWTAAANQVWPYLQQGQDVVFVSEGDVSFYSTFTYLAQTLQAQHPGAMIETIPGICSPLAAAAALGLPLTSQKQRLAVLPALYHVAELETTLTWADVVVLMKVSSVYSQIWPLLAHHQLLDRSYVIERATAPDQKIYWGLRDHPRLDLPYFSLLIIQVTPHELGATG